jgi:predicted MFS family arabinose efflux permease
LLSGLTPCTPFAASGFILGKVMGDPYGWRAPFALISLLMVPFVLFCSLAEPLSLRGLSPAAARPPSPAPAAAAAAEAHGGGAASDAAADAPPASPGSSAAGKPRSWRSLGRAFAADVLALCRVPVFVPIAAAWAAHTATVGCYSYYGPKAAKEIFRLDAADTVFGALTVCTGIAGTLAGGIVLDRWRCVLSLGAMRAARCRG